MLQSDLLNDLDDLGSDSDEEVDHEQGVLGASAESGDESLEGLEDESNDYSDDLDKSSLLRLVRQKRKHAATVQLRSKPDYLEHMSSVSAALEDPKPPEILSYTTLEDSPDYKLIVISQQLLVDIEDEKDGSITRVVELYNPRFPELEQLISNKITFVEVVQRIGNEMDVSNVNLSDILPNKLAMIVNVAASVSQGEALPEESASECNSLCDAIMELEADKALLLRFLESRMPLIAPNLSAFIGPEVAARLLALAGGLRALSMIPACNISSIGLDKRNLNGLSTISSSNNVGPLGTVDFVSGCPSIYRKKLLKTLVGKISLAARIDVSDGSMKTSEASLYGLGYRNDMLAKIELWKKPDKARTKKALPIPAEKPRSKRGGKRVRKLKERREQSELSKLANRVATSGTEGTEYGDSAMGFDRGMVGHKDVGRMRAVVEKRNELGLTKKQRKMLDVDSKKQVNEPGDGLVTSLAFTPAQGMELSDPQAASKAARATSTWFDDKGFKSSK